MIALVGSSHWDVIARGVFPEPGAVSVGEVTHEGPAGGTLNSASHLIDRRPLLISQAPSEPQPLHADLLARMEFVGAAVPTLSGATIIIGETGERSIFLARRPTAWPDSPARLAAADVIDWHWTAPGALLDRYAPLMKGRVVCSIRSLDDLIARGVRPSVIVDSSTDTAGPDDARLMASGCDCCIVTDGASGGAYWVDGTWIRYEAVPTPVVDAAGCGDAFRAGVLAGIDDGLSIAATIARAAQLGADAARFPGPNAWMRSVDPGARK
jgi:sugar/nucleoside kinase (ribokinase family)